MRWIYNVFIFRIRNKSADGTRIGLVGSTLCCIERDRSNGCSIRITVYSGKIRFHFDARRVTMKNQAYYHLPGLFEFYELYRVFLSLYREQCNTLCSLLEERNEPQNGVIIHSDLLLNYLQKNYPELYLVSSTTKVLTDFSDFLRETDREEIYLDNMLDLF